MSTEQLTEAEREMKLAEEYEKMNNSVEELALQAVTAEKADSGNAIPFSANSTAPSKKITAEDQHTSDFSPVSVCEESIHSVTKKGVHTSGAAAESSTAGIEMKRKRKKEKKEDLKRSQEEKN